MITVFSTYPEGGSATKAARALVSKKLAACASIIRIDESYFRWKGKVKRQPEFLLMIKTSKKAYSNVERFIRKTHPHEVPEIIWMDVKGGLKDYLAWVQANSG